MTREQVLAIESNRKTENKLIDKFNEHKGQLVIYMDQVVRFIGLGMDKHDWFYIFYDGKKCTFASVLMDYIPLKYKIDEDDYKKMIRRNRHNHPDVVDEHNIHYRDNSPLENAVRISELHIELLSGVADELIVEPCWEMN